MRGYKVPGLDADYRSAFPQFPNLGFPMNFLRIALVLTSLLATPVAVKDVGTVTFLEGSLRIIRGTTAFQAAAGRSMARVR